MVHDRKRSRSSSASGDEPAEQDVSPLLSADEMEVVTTSTLWSHNQPAEPYVRPLLPASADEMEVDRTLTVASHNQPEPYVPPLLPADDMVATVDHAGCSGCGISNSGSGSSDEEEEEEQVEDEEDAEDEEDEEEDEEQCAPPWEDSSSDEEEQYAQPPVVGEQYVSPLSAADMVALATSLLAHPRWGSYLRSTTEVYGVSLLEELKGKVSTACPHLADACATGLALAVLPFCTHGPLVVDCDKMDSTSEEAVAAFYTALAQPTCTVEELQIKGWTPAAAAHLGRCLNVNSTIKTLRIWDIEGFHGEAVWTAFSHALTSNATLRQLRLLQRGYSRHVGAVLADSHKLSALTTVVVSASVSRVALQATLEDMEMWGIILERNCTITDLLLDFWLPQGGLLVPVCEALLTNTTLQQLEIGVSHLGEMPRTCDNADALSLAAMLRTNQTLTHLDILTSGIVCNALVVEQGLSQNITLETLSICMDAECAQALMDALTPGGGATNNLGLRLKSLSLGSLPSRGCQCFPSAVALGNMLASNNTLISLDLGWAPYNSQEWAATILPALASNQTLQRLDLNDCRGVDGGLVYDTLLELLESNTCITELNLDETPFDEEGKAQAVEAAVEANREYGATLKNVPTSATTSCRLVLCGYPFAGKTTILQTLMCRNSSSALSPTPTKRTRGIDIQLLVINDLNMWVWDFAGQREFHPLQDFIFPTGTSVHAATAFVFTFNPISRHEKVNQVCLKGKRQFEQEFFYWLGFICSNSKPRPSRKYKPLVLVAVTHIDQVGNSVQQARLRLAVKEWVRNMAAQFKNMVTLDVERHVLFVDATNRDDKELKTFECEVISSLRTRISNVPKVPTVCDAVAKALGESGGQQLEPVISFEDFRVLCKTAAEELTSNDVHQQEALKSLFDTAGDKGCKAVAAYLRDAGEILYFSDLDFIVRNPRWFAHGILGHLIDIFPEESEPAQQHDEEQSQLAGEEDMFENGLVTKDFLTDVLGQAVNEVGLNPQGTDTDQLIILMEKLDLCYKAQQKYLIPALFKDEHGKAEKGECKRKWEPQASSHSLECIFVHQRLQCSDPFHTFITPGFFPRLQVVLKNEADEWGIKFGRCTCILEKGFCQLILNDMEIMVEYSGYFDYFVDIMVKSYRSQRETIKFLEDNIIYKIRRLCASTQGCQGVTLVKAIIRPDCVGEDITLCRFRQSVQVAALEQQIMTAPNLDYKWPVVKDDYGKTILPATSYRPQDLLDPDWSGWKQVTCYPDSNVSEGKGRGVAVIVSMVKYNTTFGDRSGGREDEDKLMKLVDELKFEVKLLQDCKAGELQSQLRDIAANRIGAEDESFLCFLMGHGGSMSNGEYFIRDQDNGMIWLDEMVKPFRTCQHLQGKPKVFFVVSCRGGNPPLVDPQPQAHVHQATGLDFIEGTEVRYLHQLTDCLMVFSTCVGSPSARYAGYGTPFIGALVSHFSHDKLQTTDVLGILNHVNKEVQEEKLKTKDGTVFGQCPVVVHTLTKPLYWKSRVV